SGNDGGLRRFGFFFGLFLFWLLFSGLLSSFRFRLFFGAFLFFFQQRFLLFFAGGAVGDIALAVEVNAAVDQCFLDHGIVAQRIAIVDDQIGILAGVDGADALIDTKLDRKSTRL